MKCGRIDMEPRKQTQADIIKWPNAQTVKLQLKDRAFLDKHFFFFIFFTSCTIKLSYCNSTSHHVQRAEFDSESRLLLVPLKFGEIFISCLQEK